MPVACATPYWSRLLTIRSTVSGPGTMRRKRRSSTSLCRETSKVWSSAVGKRTPGLLRREPTSSRRSIHASGAFGRKKHGVRVARVGRGTARSRSSDRHPLPAAREASRSTTRRGDRDRPSLSRPAATVPSHSRRVPLSLPRVSATWPSIGPVGDECRSTTTCRTWRFRPTGTSRRSTTSLVSDNLFAFPVRVRLVARERRVLRAGSRTTIRKSLASASRGGRRRSRS